MSPKNKVLLLACACVLAGLAAGGGAAFWMHLRREEAAASRQPLVMSGMPGLPTDTYLRTRTRCVSCQAQMPPGQEWAANRSKCYSCEQQIAAQGGDPTFASGTVLLG